MHLTKLQRAIIKLTVVVILAIVLIRVYQPELALMTHPSPAHQQELVTLVHQHGLGDTLLLIATNCDPLQHPLRTERGRLHLHRGLLWPLHRLFDQLVR